MITTIREFIGGAPWWVWAVFAYLISVGIKCTQRHVVYVPTLFVIPSLLLLSKYKFFLTANKASLCVYFISLIVGFGLGFLFARKTGIKIFKHQKSIEIPGTYSTLIILCSFFIIRYVFGFLQATNPELALQYAFFENVNTGLFSGYLWGKIIAYLQKFMHA